MDGIDFLETKTHTISTHQLLLRLSTEGIGASLVIAEVFENAQLRKLLSGQGQEVEYQYFKESSKFDTILSDENRKLSTGDRSGLFGEDATIPETVKSEGFLRQAQTGPKINLEYLKTLGIDPKKVLVYRATLPSAVNKPEAYWTTDFQETRRGLTREMDLADRLKAVTLVSDLQTISEGGGLIRDDNDDNGLAVRRVDTGNFNQSKAIGSMK